MSTSGGVREDEVNAGLDADFDEVDGGFDEVALSGLVSSFSPCTGTLARSEDVAPASSSSFLLLRFLGDILTRGGGNPKLKPARSSIPSIFCV